MPSKSLPPHDEAWLAEIRKAGAEKRAAEKQKALRTSNAAAIKASAERARRMFRR